MKIQKITFIFLFAGFISLLPFLATAQEYHLANKYDWTTGPSYRYRTNVSGGYTTGQSIATGLSVSCTSLPLSARVGDSVLWYSSVTGGAGNYKYFWSGSDGLTGNTSSLYKSYATPGSKSATITVSSGSQTITVGCNKVLEIQTAGTAVVSTATATSLGVSCYATSERIVPGEAAIWIAVTSVSTTYKWDGTDGLTGSGPMVVKNYPSAGVKQAVITATTPQGQNILAVCTNKVTVAPKTIVQPKPIAPAVPKKVAVVSTAIAPLQENCASSTEPVVSPTIEPLQGICTPSFEQVKINEPVSWQSTAIGGNNTYSFRWTGDDALSGEGASIIKTYDREGKKSAEVTISSGDQKLTVKCSQPVKVNAQDKEAGLLAASLFSGITGPLLLILGVLLAIVLGIWLAHYRLKKEEEKEAPPPQIPLFKPSSHDEPKH